ncbi:MAG TPA: hypothetical protein VGP13_03790 [Candidatus Paceibacterota bacterium]|jgi:hypothetical protein|nr:hypothetical protein [Candidatus Paceibacterota bacterium]
MRALSRLHLGLVAGLAALALSTTSFATPLTEKAKPVAFVAQQADPVVYFESKHLVYVAGAFYSLDTTKVLKTDLGKLFAGAGTEPLEVLKAVGYDKLPLGLVHYTIGELTTAAPVTTDSATTPAAGTTATPPATIVTASTNKETTAK